MRPDEEVRLRLVEALTRSDGSLARNQPDQFVQSVAKIETYVVNGNSTEKPEPPAEAPPAPKRKGKGVTAEKAAPEAGDDFLD